MHQPEREYFQNIGDLFLTYQIWSLRGAHGKVYKNLFERQDWEIQSVRVLSVLFKNSSRDIDLAAHYNFSYPSHIFNCSLIHNYLFFSSQCSIYVGKRLPFHLMVTSPFSIERSYPSFLKLSN